MKKIKLLTGTSFVFLALLIMLIPSHKIQAAGKSYTPITQYYGKKVKLGSYYFWNGGNTWFACSKKKNPSESQWTMIRPFDDIVTNGSSVYGYYTKWGAGATVKYHTIYKFNIKDGSKKKLKKITDKVNPDNSSEDGFRFGNVYGSKLYYNVTQKLTKSKGKYVYTYKLMSMDIKSKKVKTARKNFEILAATKNYIFGRNNKNAYYVFNLKQNKFYKMTGMPKSKIVDVHSYGNTVYAAVYTGRWASGYKKIVIYKLDGSKKKAGTYKSWKTTGSDYVDGFFNKDVYHYSKNLSKFYKMDLKTKKMTEISMREYNWELDPDYGDESGE